MWPIELIILRSRGPWPLIFPWRETHHRFNSGIDLTVNLDSAAVLKMREDGASALHVS